MLATVWQIANDRKRKSCESAEFYLEKFMKSLYVKLFSADFSHLEPLCSGR